MKKKIKEMLRQGNSAIDFAEIEFEFSMENAERFCSSGKRGKGWRGTRKQVRALKEFNLTQI